MPKSTPRTTKKTATKPNDLSEIAPGVYVGGWKAALGFEGTRFCVLDEAPADMPPATHIAIYDAAADRADRGRLDALAKAVTASRARGEPVLVFCGHGVRRSPLAAAWYLHRAEGISLDAAYARVRLVRPKVELAGDWLGNAGELVRD